MGNYYLNGYAPPEGVMDGNDVKAVQRQLNAAGARLTVDGVWGPKTEAAYRSLNGGGGYAAQYGQGLNAFMQQMQAMLSVPEVSYTPQSEAALRAQIQSALRPQMDAAIAERREATKENAAALDVDAWARGMGRSTYLTDMKDRQLDDEADDIARMEAEYSATLASLLMEAMEAERERALEAQMHNANAYAGTRQLAFSSAQDAYGTYLQSLQAAQKRGGESSSNDAAATSEENCRLFLSYLTPEERGNIYKGVTEKDRAYRDELIASLGRAGYVAIQQEFPGLSR
ncbi:MAG TPA: peptidoglycan-binding domain-containing protein [Feifaniaceae bacterium]|nr:peptidoglycan-binding domain-containing protein [Feifaniaceae bacterium]